MSACGLYVHIPFCSAKCPYCDFYSVTDLGLADSFMQAVIKETEIQTKLYEAEYDTVYFGGGTPLVFGAGRIAVVLKALRDMRALVGGAEISAEVNPETASPESFRILAGAGVNRVSIGLQSSSEAELAFLGRRHTAADFERTARAAEGAGITNISADIMLGLCGQTGKTVRESVRFAVRCGAVHLSAYLLKIEKDTPFYENGVSAVCPGEDEQECLYLAACEEAESLGLMQYEISNFARPGFECRHNLKYWRCESYIGAGPAAHSFIGGRRFFHKRDIRSYISAPCDVTDDGRGGDFDEYVMLALRLAEGVNLLRLAEKYPGADIPKLVTRAKTLGKAGLCSVGDSIRLTRRGLLISNAVIAELLK